MINNKCRRTVFRKGRKNLNIVQLNPQELETIILFKYVKNNKLLLFFLFWGMNYYIRNLIYMEKGCTAILVKLKYG